MPKKSKIMKKNPALSIQQKIIARLLKELKLKGNTPNMRGGCKICDYVSGIYGKKLHPMVRKQLASELNKFIRLSKKQRGGGVIQDWFTGKKAKKFWGDVGHGFVKGFTGVSKIAQPILDVVTLFQPELAPLTAGVHLFNKAVK